MLKEERKLMSFKFPLKMSVQKNYSVFTEAGIKELILFTRVPIELLNRLIVRTNPTRVVHSLIKLTHG